jgi:hypothetical protein
VILADRDMVETESDLILKNADKEDVSLLVVGDPFGQVARLIIKPYSSDAFVVQRRTQT